MISKRCVCGKVITSQFDLCGNCEAEYGLDRSKWPEWLVFMVADLKREYRQRLVIEDREIPFSKLGIF
jgi:hypothetical protein